MFRSSKLIILLLFAVTVKALFCWLLLDPLRHTGWSGHMHVDIWGWLAFLKDSAAGKIPYVEFSKEYPIGIGTVFWLVSSFIDGSRHNLLLNFHAVIFSILEVLNVWLFYQILILNKSKKPFLYSIFYLLIPTSLIVGPFRYESLVNLFFFISLILYFKNKDRFSSVFLAIGTAFKWYPVFFMAAREWRNLWKDKKLKPFIINSIIFLGVILLINLPFVLMGWLSKGNLNNWLYTYQFHVNRPLYWDTPFGVLSLWLGYQPAEQNASLFSLALMALVMIVRPKANPIAKTAAVIIASLVWNRVYSTQFHLWFIPLCLIYGSTQIRSKQTYILLLLGILEVLNVMIYPFSFTWCLQEIGGFTSSVAADKGQFWTWIFTLMILIRPILLVELIRTLLFSDNTYSRLQKYLKYVTCIGVIIYSVWLINFSVQSYSVSKLNTVSAKKLNLQKTGSPTRSNHLLSSK